MRQFIRDVDENGDPVIKELGASSLTLKQIVADGGLIQKGTVDVGALAANAESNITITFPTPFSATPSISVERVATSSYWSFLEWTILSRSSTGFVLHVINNGAGTIPAGLRVEWTAIAGAVIDIPPAINYSTAEQKTGRKWIDGKDIYSKCLTYTGSLGSPKWFVPDGWSSFSANVDRVVNCRIIANNTLTTSGFSNYSNVPFLFATVAQGIYSGITNASDATIQSWIVYIEYTKN